MVWQHFWDGSLTCLLAVQQCLDKCLWNSASDLSPPMDHFKMDFYYKIKYILRVTERQYPLPRSLLTQCLHKHLPQLVHLNRNSPPSQPLPPPPASANGATQITSTPESLLGLPPHRAPLLPFLIHIQLLLLAKFVSHFLWDAVFRLSGIIS